MNSLEAAGRMALWAIKLNEFNFETADSILHFFQVLLHPLISALVDAANLTCYYLGIAMHDHIFNICCLCEV